MLQKNVAALLRIKENNYVRVHWLYGGVLYCTCVLSVIVVVSNVD